MGAKVDTKTFVTTKDGSTFQVESTDKIENVTGCKVVCDGPRCGVRRKPGGPIEVAPPSPITFEFCQEDVAKSIDNYPEVGDYFLSVVLPPRSPSFGTGQPKAFCSAGCLRDFLSYSYIAPGPREPVQEPDGTPSAEDLDKAVREAIPGVTAAVEGAD